MRLFIDPIPLLMMLYRSLIHRQLASSARAEGNHRFINLVNAIQTVQRKKRDRPSNTPHNTIKLKQTNDEFFVRDKAYENMPIHSLASILCQSYMKLPPFSPYPPDKPLNESQSTRRMELKDNRFDILRYLVIDCGPNEDRVISLIKSFHDHADPKNSSNSEFMQELRDSMTPEYERMFKKIIGQADRGLALAFLIQLREDVRAKIQYFESNTARPCLGNRDHGHETERLKFLDEDVKDLLSILCRTTCLELKRISLDQTSEVTLEKIARNDAVHPLETVDDLKDRLRSGRRCYALFHPSLPNEPIVIIHTVLLETFPCTLKDLDKGLPDSNIAPRVAAFYSITNAHPGLSGLELGAYLIKKVMTALQSEYNDCLLDFVTLSPIPGFRSWALKNKAMILAGKYYSFINEDEKAALANVLESSLKDNEPPTKQQRREIERAHNILMRLAANYLCTQNDMGQPLDKVARFHMRNGASMFRLNFLADSSSVGFTNSFGIMVNYHYCPETIEENQCSFEKGNLAIQTAIKDLL